MTQSDLKRIARCHNLTEGYNGDNSAFIVHEILPRLSLPQSDKQVIRWAYGYDGEVKNYEMESDGETGVKDYFLNGVVKSPAGVAHDYINRVPGHTTPDGKEWTRQESNQLYLRIAKAIGYPPVIRWRRWLFLSLTWFWWNKIKRG